MKDEILQYEQEKKKMQKKKNWKEVAVLCNSLGMKYQELGKYDDALKQHEDELELLQQLKDQLGIAVAHRRIGEVYCEMKDFRQALRHQKIHLNMAQKLSNTIEEQRAWATIGRTHLHHAQDVDCGSKNTASEEANKAFLFALKLCDKLEGTISISELKTMKSRIYLNLGIVFQKTNATKAEEFIRQALVISEITCYEDRHRCHSALASLYQLDKNVPNALKEGKIMLDLAKKLCNKTFQADAYIFLGEMHLSNSDFDASKKMFYKAYKFKISEYKEHITKFLKILVNLCITKNVLLNEEDDIKKIELYESLGDDCCKIECYSQAIIYYKEILNIAKEINIDKSKLATIYLSIARTYEDDNKLKEALDYYDKELQLSIDNDPKEACKTLLKICILKEDLQYAYHSLEEDYKKAYELSREANYPKLEVTILRNHVNVKELPIDRKCELLDEKEKLCKIYGFPSDIEVSDDEEDDCLDNDINLDDYDFSDSDSDTETVTHPRRKGTKKQLHTKKNEKGETPLHVACINGDFNRASNLIKQGHPVNIRDNSGWLPLHEACNNNFCNIAELLIENGAWINDRGGKYCEGTSPLHDAATCGNVNVIKLLISKGASVVARNDNGNTPLDCLDKFCSQNYISSSDVEVYEELHEEMKEAMEKVGFDFKAAHNNFKIKTKNSNFQNYTNRKNITSFDDSSTKETEFNDCSNESSMSFFSDSHNNSKNSATKKYLDAISGLGSANKRIESGSQRKPELLKSKSKSAFLSEDDVIDDWLDDDLKGTNKRKRKYEIDYKVGHLDKHPRLGNSSSFSNVENIVEKLSGDEMEAKASNSTDGNMFIDEDPSFFDDNCFTNPVPIFSNVTHDFITSTPITEASVLFKKSKQLKLTNIVQKKKTSFSDCSSKTITLPSDTDIEELEDKRLKSNLLRLKVKVQTITLLVPIPASCQHRSISWLADEVARRYYQQNGIKPKLTLTLDGAVLDPNDNISLVLSPETNEIDTIIKSWDLPPLLERYSQACQCLQALEIDNLSSTLIQTESTATLDLSCSYLRRFTEINPILRSIQRQPCLHTINMSGCCLTDEGMDVFLDVLPSIPSITSLIFKSTSISSSGFFSFTKKFNSDLICKNLKIIDFSYNNLSGTKLSTFISLLSIPSLNKLALKKCHLYFPNGVEDKHVSELSSLELDYNILYGPALVSILNCAPRLQTLSLSGVNRKEKVSSNFMNALSGMFYNEAESCIESLDLSYCNLRDIDIEVLCACLNRCINLSSLNFSFNPAVTPQMMINLLDELKINKKIPLKDFILHGNPSLPSNPNFVEALCSLIKDKNITNSFTSLSLNISTSNKMLINHWNNIYKDKSKINIFRNVIYFKVDFQI